MTWIRGVSEMCIQISDSAAFELTPIPGASCYHGLSRCQEADAAIHCDLKASVGSIRRARRAGR
jgi:hypothetical protein